MAQLPRIVVGVDGRIALVNQHAQRLLGFGEHELIGRRSELLLDEPHREAHARARDEFLAEPSFDAEPLAPGRIPLMTRAGRQVYALLHPEPLLRGDRLWLSLTLQEA